MRRIDQNEPNMANMVKLPQLIFEVNLHKIPKEWIAINPPDLSIYARNLQKCAILGILSSKYVEIFLSYLYILTFL